MRPPGLYRHNTYANGWWIFSFSRRIFWERSSFVFHSLFPWRVICLPTIDVTYECRYEYTWLIWRMQPAVWRIQAWYCIREKNATSNEIEKKWSIATVDWKLRWNSEWIARAHAIMLDVRAKKRNKSIAARLKVLITLPPPVHFLTPDIQ